jgi:hypothetical protein
MRSVAPAGLVFLATTAVAQPLGFGPHDTAPPAAPLTMQFQPRFAAPRPDSSALIGRTGDTAMVPIAGTRGLSIGPLKLESRTEMIGRKVHRVAHLRLDGVSILGASVGGSVDGRGATVSLHWSN